MIEKIKKNLDKIEYAIMFLIFMYIMFLQPRHVMWLDELDWGVGILIENNSLKDIILAVLKTGENLPLFYITIYIVKSIFGYNEFFLVLESTIIAFIGVIGLIKLTRKFFNKYIEFISVFLIMTSYMFVSYCGLQVRPYALLFCFSTWTLYFYLKRLETENWKNIVKYGVSMIFLMYSHWFGVLISLCYAFTDLVLFFRKRVSFKCIVSYIIGGLAFLPSFITLLYFHDGDVKEFGVENADIATVIYIFKMLTNDITLNILFLIIAYICTLILFFRKKDNYIGVVSFSSFILMVGVIIFSLMNPKASLLRERYFITVLPHLTILLSWLLYEILKLYKRYEFKILVVTLIFIEAFYSISYFCILSYNIPNVIFGLFKSNSDYFKSQEDCYLDNTLIICTYGKTWVKYYFELKGEELPKNIIVQDPLKYPNTLHMTEVDLSDLEYCVKDGKYVESGEVVDDISEYDTIYYIEEYRKLSSDLKKELKEDYKKEFYDKKLKLTKLVKITDK